MSASNPVRQEHKPVLIEQEAQGADFGDKRLALRLHKILSGFDQHPSASIPGALGGWADVNGAYRFFDNDSVTMQKILDPHHSMTVERMRGQPVVLALQDTTFINYPGQRETTGLGPHSHDYDNGLFLHPVIAVTPERLCLGVLHAETWARPPMSPSRKKKKRVYRPIEEKESMRWLRACASVSELHAQLPGTKLVNVSDRESDIYELFARAQTEKSDWLIRAENDRNTTEGKRLRAVLAGKSVLGSYDVDVPRHKGKAARTATVEVHSCRIRLLPPQRPNEKLPEVEVTVVLVQEKNPPEGRDPVDWLLLSSLPEPKTFEEAQVIINWYTCRWMIEIYFNILKSGCTIEDLQLQTCDRLERAIAVYIIVAWRLLFTTYVARTCPDAPASTVFTKEETAATFAVARIPMPKKAPTIGEMVRLVAQLGGYINKKSTGPVGPKTLWRGWQRLRDIVLGMHQAQMQI